MQAEDAGRARECDGHVPGSGDVPGGRPPGAARLCAPDQRPPRPYGGATRAVRAAAVRADGVCEPHTDLRCGVVERL